MADDVDKQASTAPVPANVQDPYTRPVSERNDITGQLMSTPGRQPVFDLSNSASGMTFREVGNSGLRIFAGWVKEEILLELQGRQGAQKYREMADNSPIVGAILFTIQSTFRKVDWRVIPNEDAPRGPAQEAADFIESCMNDMSHTWADFMIEVLSCLQYGYSFHEIVYKKRLGKHPPMLTDAQGFKYKQASSDYDDGAIGWRRFPIRGQDTILSWFMDVHGITTGVRQLPWTGVIRDVPIDKALLFRPVIHKNNPEGRSILRTAYVPYYMVKRLQEQEAIIGERLGGVPVVSVPSAMIEAANAGDAKAVASMNSFKNLAVNLRIDEQMGIVKPSDVWQGANGPTPQEMFKLELITPTGGRGMAMNFEAAITRYNLNMLTATLTDFLTLGHEARGTQSLAVTKVDLFFQAVEGYLNGIASVFNKYAVTRLMELNGMDLGLQPKIEPDLAQRIDLDVLSNFVLRLSQAGMPMFPNEELQTFLLDAGGMPDVSDPRALQAAGLLDEQLDQKDEMQDVQLDNAKNPPQPAGPNGKGNGTQKLWADGGRGMSRLEKMLLASLGKRMIRSAGPRFPIRTARRKKRLNGASAQT